MSLHVDADDRKRLEELSSRLRAAACAALENRSALARSLDETRSEVERLLMLSTVDAYERRRAVVRAEMMLNAWQSMGAGTQARLR